IVSCFFFSSRRRHTRSKRDWSSDVCSSDLEIIKNYGIGLFAVELKETNGWLGFIGLNYVPKESKYSFDELPFYEIGWRLIPEVWGNGLATEGAESVLTYAKQQGINEVYAFTSESNAASRKVMEKIGMERYDYFE